MYPYQQGQGSYPAQAQVGNDAYDPYLHRCNIAAHPNPETYASSELLVSSVHCAPRVKRSQARHTMLDLQATPKQPMVVSDAAGQAGCMCGAVQ